MKLIRDFSFYSNSLYLMIDSVSSALLGFIFWFVAAKLFDTNSVGISSALISAVSLLSFISILGQDTGIIRFLPDSPDKKKIANATFTLSNLVAFVISIIFVAGVSFWSPSLIIIKKYLLYAVMFVISVVIYVNFSMVGAICISFRRADYSLIRSLIFNAGKLLILFGMTCVFGMLGIFFSWGISVMLAMLVGLFFLIPKLINDFRPALRLELTGSKEMLYFSLTNYIANGLWNIPQWLLPLLMVNILGATANAQFFIGQSVGNIVAAIPGAVATSLFAEGSNKIDSLPENLKKGLIIIVLILFPSILILIFFGRAILWLFGQEYASGGTFTMCIYTFSAIPLSIISPYLAVARVKKHLKRIIWINGGLAGIILVISFICLKTIGINGAAIGWLVGHTIMGLILLPFLVKTLLARESSHIIK